MCLGIPGRITKIWEDRGTRMADVDFGGATKDVCLAYLPDAQIGDYTIVHAGFGLTKLDEASALETLAMFQSLGMLEDELGIPSRPGATPSAAGIPADGGASTAAGRPANGGASTPAGMPADGGASTAAGMPADGGASAPADTSPSAYASPATGTSPAASAATGARP